MKNELLFKQDEMKKHTNEDKPFWRGSWFNIQDNDWININSVSKFEFDQPIFNDDSLLSIYIHFNNGNLNTLTLEIEQHNDIRFEILDYLDKL